MVKQVGRIVAIVIIMCPVRSGTTRKIWWRGTTTMWKQDKEMLKQVGRILAIVIIIIMIDVMPSRCWELFGGYEEIGTLDKPPLPALQQ